LLPHWVKRDEKLVKKALEASVFNYAYIDTNLQNKIHLIKFCLKKEAEVFILLDKKYLANFELVMMAVSQKGELIKYAHETLRDHPKMMKVACEKNINNIQYASERLKNDREFVKFLFELNQGVDFITYLSEELQLKIKSKKPYATFLTLLEVEKLENQIGISNHTHQKNKL
jgi:hypothetical protein